MAAFILPAAEYRITFGDGSIATITVDPEENLHEVIAAYLDVQDTDADAITSVELVRSFEREEKKD